MILLLSVAVSLVVAVLTAGHRWRLLGIGCAFLLRIGIPSVVGTINVPGSPHLSTILILCFALVWPVTDRTALETDDNDLPSIPRYCHAAVGATVVGGVLMSGSQSAMVFSAGLALNQIIAPYVFCVLLYNSLRRDPSLYSLACRFFAAVCVFEALLALAVFYQIVRQPFESAYLTHAYWHDLGTRQSGTLDHPLTLGLLLAAGISFATYFRSRVITATTVVVLIAGIAVTQSRLAIFGAAASIAYILVSRAKSPLSSFSYGILAVIGYAAVNQLGLLEGLNERLRDDQGSAEGRRRAALIFLDNWGEFKLWGLGFDYTKEYFLVRGIPSSSESAAFSYVVGIGLPLTFLYFGLIVWMIGRGISLAGKLLPAGFAAILVFTLIQFYASIATQSAAGIILWATIGFSLAAQPTSRGTIKTPHPVTHRNPKKAMDEKQLPVS